MSKDYANLPPTAMRRSDRAVTDEAWIRRFLHQATVGILATVYEGQPYINTRLFAYDEEANCLHIHGARVGRTATNIDVNPRICFSVIEMGRILPADAAIEFGQEYAGVMVFGPAHMVKDREEASRALQMLMDKYAPHLESGVDYRPVEEADVKTTGVFCIAIESWSGKKKEAVADFPGAYWYTEAGMLESVKGKTTSE